MGSPMGQSIPRAIVAARPGEVVDAHPANRSSVAYIMAYITSHKNE
jgi:hypothetical protein